MSTLAVRTFNQCLKKSLWSVIQFNKRLAVNLAYNTYIPQVFSSRVPIIVLHGMLGSKRNWQSMCYMIMSNLKRPVIAVDARNHGDSPKADSHTYMDLAGDVSQLLNKLSIAKATVIGHSMGGRTAMVLALTEPSKVSDLIVVDISPVPTGDFARSTFIPRLLKAMQSVNFDGTKDLISARKRAADAIVKSGVVENMSGMDFILMNITQLPDTSYSWKLNPGALRSHYNEIASFPSEMLSKKFLKRTLFIGGGDSYFIPREDIKVIQKLFPQAQVLYIPGVGHNVHAENPYEFLNVVTKFLTEN